MLLASQVSKLLRIFVGTNTTVVRCGITWSLDIREAIDLSIFLTGGFQNAVVRAILGEMGFGGTLIDVGANRGSVCVPIAKQNERCRVFAIEPVGARCEDIRRILSLNRDLNERLSVDQVYLTDGRKTTAPTETDASWNLLEYRRNGNSFGAIRCSTEGCEALTLDEFAQAKKIESVTVIKLDVDGNEYSVLLGGQNLIKTCRPVIVMEWAPSVMYRYDNSPSSLTSLLKHLMYQPFIIRRKKVELLTWQSLIEMRMINESCDVLLRPC
jgi:FkbM family methyltransferase